MPKFDIVAGDCESEFCGKVQCVDFFTALFKLIFKGFECNSEAPICGTCKHRFLFDDGSIDDITRREVHEGEDVPHRRMSDLMDELGSNRTASLLVKEGILDPVHFEPLKEFIDTELEKELAAGTKTRSGYPINEDYILNISPEQLTDVIGLDAILKLHDAYIGNNPEYPVTRFVGRRIKFDTERHMQWHIDGPNAVMHVFVNEDEVEGGNYLFVNEDGLTEVETKSGDGIIHSHNVAHSIAHFTGMRYHLMLVGDHPDRPNIMAPFTSEF